MGQDATFVQSVLFTLEYTAIVTPAISWPATASPSLVRRRRRGSALLRTLFFLPYVVGLMTESFLLLLELQPGSGGVNAVLKGLHITNGQTAWLVHTNLALAAVAAAPTITRRQEEHPEARTARAFYAAVGTVGGVGGVLFAAPLAWAVLRSFESEAAIISAPKIADFTHLTFTNYQQLMGGSIHILHYVGNSLIVAAGTVLTAVLATAAGYGFGRFRFRGRAHPSRARVFDSPPG